jgi:hypothetical protein
MPVDAKVYRIFIASPIDITEERKVIREKINLWNSLNSSSYQMFLHPVEGRDSAPSLKDRGQAIINKLVDDCDLLIGIFWTRLGTKTSEAESGTVEEIDRARSTEKRCMIYFRNESESPNDHGEYERLQKYKEKLKPNGLIDEYESIEDFTKRVFDHISSAVNEIFNENTQRLAIENRAKVTEDAIGLNITGSGGDVNIKNLLINPSSSSINISFNALSEAKFSVRALLESRFGIQDMEDIKEQEIAKIQSTLSSPQMAALFNQAETVETISTITKIMEEATTSSIYALAMIGRYADDGSPDWLDIVGDWIERLCIDQPVYSPQWRWVSQIKCYSALLLLYTLGISSLRAGNINFLKEVISMDVYLQTYNDNFPLLLYVKPNYIFQYGISSMIEPGVKSHPMPVSNHLENVIKNTLYSNEEENQYLNWFDFFEFLLCFKRIQQEDVEPYFGSFSYRRTSTWGGDIHKFMFKMIQDAATNQGKYGAKLLDFFGGDEAFEEAAKRYDQIASKSGSDFGLRIPPHHITQLIDFAKQGKRISTYRELNIMMSRTV